MIVKHISTPHFIGFLHEAQQKALTEIAKSQKSFDALRIEHLGSNSELSYLSKQLISIDKKDRKEVGIILNDVKNSILQALEKKHAKYLPKQELAFDSTIPGIQPLIGHLHLVSQAIIEITRIFEKIGFSRVRYPEVDWDWYAFESLNMPPDHPARDEWETFHIKNQISKIKYQKSNNYKKFNSIVLTPHTSNGQVREMEKGMLPIRMINIAKCYRRQIDISHTPMFYQFEGLYVDKNVSISHLIGVTDYFVKQYFGPERKVRLRPFHFQFTEPSFEVDINCGICLGSGKLKNGESCRLCKSGWLELGGTGMVHPAVLKNGGVDPQKYHGFAFGWGIERCVMMKNDINIPDNRILYENDVRFLEQF